MARSTLLNAADPMFPFEHAMAHRNALGIMSPLDRFSTIPYWIEPDLKDNRPASMWNLNHQSAHDDAMNYLPQYFGAETVGLRVGQNLVDSNLDDPEQRTWFTFQNHMEHLIGGDTILPNVQFPEPAPQWVWPFW